MAAKIANKHPLGSRGRQFMAAKIANKHPLGSPGGALAG